MNRKLLSLALVCSIYNQLNASPSGFSKVAGTAKAPYVDSSGAMVVESGKKAVIEWDSFSIDSQEIFRFAQKDKSSAVLNRVKGQDISSILGTLQSNGRVYLINPNGIVIGSSGLVQTGGFLASTADISNTSFFHALNLNLSNFGSGSIVNLGTIQCETGDVSLFARTVRNEGKITASAGSVHLGSGPQILLKPDGSQHLFISIEGDESFNPKVENTGLIEALTTEIKTAGSVYEKAISHSGRIEAINVYKENNRVYLTSQEGLIEISGEIAAPGGSLNVNATDIHLTKSSKIDVTETGRVMVKASRTTAFEGFIDGQGDTADGASVELSADIVRYLGKINLLSKQGKAGTLLLDPKTINITSTGTDSATGQTFAFNPSGTSNISGADLGTAINAANVVLQANSDINFNDTCAGTTIGNGLTLQAGRSVIFTSAGSLTLTGGDLNITMNDPGAIAAFRDSGGAQFYMQTGSSINTTGGDITIAPGNFCAAPAPAPGACPPVGEVLIEGGAVLEGRGGDISITGIANPLSGNPGVQFRSAANVTTNATGTITIHGTGGAVTTDDNIGVDIGEGFTLVQTVNGNIEIHGTGKGTGDNNYGYFQHFGAKVQTTGAGGISIFGIGGDGANLNRGAYIIDTNTAITAQSGPVLISGTGGGLGTGSDNKGLQIGGQVVVQSNGSDVTIIGQGGSGTSSNEGVLLQDTGTTIVSTNGNVSITGTGGVGSNDNNTGIHLFGGPTINAPTGKLLLTGTAQSGVNANDGINIDTGAQLFGAAGMEFKGFGAGTGNNNTGINAIFITLPAPTLIPAPAPSPASCALGPVAPPAPACPVYAIKLHGEGGNGTNINNGLHLSNVTINSFDNEAICLEGIAGGTGNNDTGILTNFCLINSACTGVINLTGTSAGSNTNAGIQMFSTTVQSLNGDINFDGTTLGTTTQNAGVLFQANSQINSLGEAVIRIIGDGGPTIHGTNLNPGVAFFDSSVSSNQSDIFINGTASGTGSLNFGVYFGFGNSSLSSSGEHISIIGTGSASATGSDNSGIQVDGVLSINSSSNAVPNTIHLNGQGGGTGFNSRGIDVTNDLSITGTNNASILLEGIGANGASGGDTGILFEGNSTTIQSQSGDITLNGTGQGSGNTCEGIDMNQTSISSTSGAIHLTGFGSVNGNDEAKGIKTFNNVSITNVNGEIVLNGTGGGTGSGVRAHGQDLQDVTIDTSTGTGAILINGTGGLGTANDGGVQILGGTISGPASTNNITINGTAIGSGTADIGVLIDDHSTISSAGLTDINITGFGGTGQQNIGTAVVISDINSASGQISITGTGGGVGTTDNYGIAVISSTIQGTGIAPIFLNGTGSRFGTDANHGLLITDLVGRPAVITTDQGGMALEGGFGGTNNNNNGVLIEKATQIFTNTGGIVIGGSQGSIPSLPVDNNAAVKFSASGVSITTTTGQISITGAATASGDNNPGVLILEGNLIQENGNFPTDILGLSFQGTNADGVVIQGPSTLIQVKDADLTITGQSFGDPTLNPGIWIKDGAKLQSTGSANINLITDQSGSGNGDIIIDN